MKCRILFAASLILMSTYGAVAIEKTTVELHTLVKTFEQNPSDVKATIQLLKELNKQGKSGQEVIDRYFQTQKEADYYKDYNWAIVRDFVTDVNAPQLQYVFKNCDKFVELFSKDDVFQKLDNVLVNHLEQLYKKNKNDYEASLKKIEEGGYEHYDVVRDYFYKARKLFRYFPENRQMIKEITAGALEIMTDVSRLKVIQLWAGKTVESQSDFDAICNYVKISQKCGFYDVAKRYASVANKLAAKSGSDTMKELASELMKMIN